jgi:hypothetical protein
VSNEKRLCKGLCISFKAKKPSVGSRYGSGQVRCAVCCIFMSPNGMTESKYCKCCHYRVRLTPRNKVFKEKLRNNTT